MRILNVAVQLLRGKPISAIMKLFDRLPKNDPDRASSSNINKAEVQTLTPFWEVVLPESFDKYARLRILNGDIQYCLQGKTTCYGRIDVANQMVIAGPQLISNSPNLLTNTGTPLLWNNFVFLESGDYDTSGNIYWLLIFDFQTGKQLGMELINDHIQSCEIVDDCMIIWTNSGFEIFDLKQNHLPSKLSDCKINIEVKMEYISDPFKIENFIFLPCIEGMILVSRDLKSQKTVKYELPMDNPNYFAVRDGVIGIDERGRVVYVNLFGDLREDENYDLQSVTTLIACKDILIIPACKELVYTMDYQLGALSIQKLDGRIHGFCKIDENYFGALVYRDFELSFIILDQTFEPVKAIEIDNLMYELGDDCSFHRIAGTSRLVVYGEYGFLILNLMLEQIEGFHSWIGKSPMSQLHTILISDEVILYRFQDGEKYKLAAIKF